MTFRSDDAEQLALAQQHNAALARTLYAATVERDALRAEVGRLTAQLKSITAENHSRAQREARSLEEWVNLRAELEAARAALGAAWCGGMLAEGIARKCAWLEALANEETR
jgi:hypothetical protein